MAANVIGKVKSTKNKTYSVKWDKMSKTVYVGYAGTTKIGTATSPTEAMIKAEAWVYDK